MVIFHRYSFVLASGFSVPFSLEIPEMSSKSMWMFLDLGNQLLSPEFMDIHGLILSSDLSNLL